MAGLRVRQAGDRGTQVHQGEAADVKQGAMQASADDRADAGVRGETDTLGVDAAAAAARADEDAAETALLASNAAQAQARAFARKTAARQWIFRTGPNRAKAMRIVDEPRGIREGDR